MKSETRRHGQRAGGESRKPPLADLAITKRTLRSTRNRAGWFVVEPSCNIRAGAGISRRGSLACSLNPPESSAERSITFRRSSVVSWSPSVAEVVT